MIGRQTALTPPGHAVDHPVPLLLVQTVWLPQPSHLPQVLPWGHDALWLTGGALQSLSNAQWV